MPWVRLLVVAPAEVVRDADEDAEEPERGAHRDRPAARVDLVVQLHRQTSPVFQAFNISWEHLSGLILTL